MIILIDKDNLVTSYATAGGFDGGIEIPNSSVPETFIAEFKNGKFKYENGIVSYNRDFSDNDQTTQLKAINESLEEKVRNLETRVLELEALLSPLE